MHRRSRGGDFILVFIIVGKERHELFLVRRHVALWGSFSRGGGSLFILGSGVQVRGCKGITKHADSLLDCVDCVKTGIRDG